MEKNVYALNDVKAWTGLFVHMGFDEEANKNRAEVNVLYSARILMIL